METLLDIVQYDCGLTGRCAQGHRLASILFRVGPQEPIKKGQKLEIHPMLDLVDCIGTHEGDPDKATLYLDDSVGNAFDYPAVDDFATRPACTKLHIRVSGSAVASVGCNTGITIRQILRKTIPAWLRCFYDSPDGRFDGPFEGRVYWDGWISAEGQEDGSVLLMSRSLAYFRNWQDHALVGAIN